jgi:hypothetical protein
VLTDEKVLYPNRWLVGLLLAVANAFHTSKVGGIPRTATLRA